jgi:hypothetical protein
MEPTYQFRNGAHIKGGVDANSVGTELDRIRESQGEITPQGVVNESRPTNAPLNPCFTWDDTEAAEAYRRDEARKIVRSVRVVYPDTRNSEPAFVHIRREDPAEDGQPQGGYYERARTVAQNFNLYDNAWRSAQERLSAAARSLTELEALARQHISDEQSARMEAVAAAKARVNEASDLLAIK